MNEPRDPLTRYASGFTDEKPPWTYWFVLACMIGFILYRVFA